MPPRQENTSFVPAALFVLVAVLGAGFFVSRLVDSDTEIPQNASRSNRVQPASGALAPRPTRREREAHPAREARAERRLPQANRDADASVPRPPVVAQDANAAPPERRRKRARDGRERGARNRGGEKRPENAAPATNASAPKSDAAGRPANATSNQITADYSPNAIDRALTDAGIDPGTMQDIKNRYEELNNAEHELRVEASRDGWLNTPRFSEEMNAIETDRLAIRDQVGDEAYDMILFATGRTNRVLVSHVDQPQANVIGDLQPGDIIVRYDGVRIFSPAGLLTEMAAGSPGHQVSVDILRQGKPMQLDIPDGLLPIGIEPAQEPPDRLR